jgi:hypothetical protein
MPLVSRFPTQRGSKRTASFDDVNRELLRLDQLVREPAPLYVALTQWNAAPAKPFSGMTVYADGVNWNPGGGEGVYTYYAGAWNRLG